MRGEKRTASSPSSAVPVSSPPVIALSALLISRPTRSCERGRRLLCREKLLRGARQRRMTPSADGVTLGPDPLSPLTVCFGSCWLRFRARAGEHPRHSLRSVVGAPTAARCCRSRTTPRCGRGGSAAGLAPSGELDLRRPRGAPPSSSAARAADHGETGCSPSAHSATAGSEVNALPSGARSSSFTFWVRSWSPNSEQPGGSPFVSLLLGRADGAVSPLPR